MTVQKYLEIKIPKLTQATEFKYLKHLINFSKHDEPWSNSGFKIWSRLKRCYLDVTSPVKIIVGYLLSNCPRFPRDHDRIMKCNDRQYALEGSNTTEKTERVRVYLACRPAPAAGPPGSCSSQGGWNNDKLSGSCFRPPDWTRRSQHQPTKQTAAERERERGGYCPTIILQERW